jgi:hypothetical protein
MNFWATLVAYELVWFAAVIGAGQGLVWPAVTCTVLFAVWRVATSTHRGIELKLIVVGLLLGVILEDIWVRLGLLRYSAPWPTPTHPAWILALWVAFALTVLPLFAYLRARPWLAALFGGLGGPLAYLGAARGWHAVLLPARQWPSLLALSVGWGIALPCLTVLARHWLATAATGPGSAQ